jgi:hypothetical protein
LRLVVDIACSGKITVNPLGLFWPDAIFARNLLIDTPAVAVSFVSWKIAVLIYLAITEFPAFSRCVKNYQDAAFNTNNFTNLQL